MNLNPLKIINSLISNKVLVLMYHRIAELDSDPWQLAVTPKNFEEHLSILTKKYNVISSTELIESLKKKSLPSKSVCITFDDGYSDNYLSAKPLLEKYQCPATFFISSKYLEQQKLFWWDELEDIILGSEILPQELSILINDELFEFNLENDFKLTDQQRELHKNWVWTEKPPTQRCELYFAIWEKLKLLPFDEQQSVIENLKQWANYQNINKQNLPMTLQQLSEMSKQSLFELGLHTVTHPVMSFHSTEFQSQEIADNEVFLKEYCPNYIRVIAYPFGNYNQDTLSVVEKQNLNAAFTTSEKVVNKYTDLWEISRFQVKNLNGTEFQKQLSKWIRTI